MRRPNVVICLITLLLVLPDSQTSIAGTPDSEVSYYRQIRPVLQAHCEGCHQPAKRSGDYVLTSVAQLLRNGESGESSVVSGKPEESALLAMVTPVDGKAKMPPNGPPLSNPEIELIRKWIAEGAKDDSPPSASPVVDQNNPPIYHRAPSITSIDYSPDGKFLAVAGFHEAIILPAELPAEGDSQPIARLVGLSEKIESVAFSPDSQKLAVAGGQPFQNGEIQIWNVPTQKLEQSISTTFDTVYGVAWSPDGKSVSVGCSDTAVRGFEVETGKQFFFNGAHDDWPLDTVFSTDGSLLISVGRDMSTKLYHVSTERFIDNVTSITPGALKGGISAVAKHPTRDEILVGGSDGIPRIYRMERVTKRVIGDDANLIRKFPSMPGRITAVAYSPDGKSIACLSSHNGTGHVSLFDSDFPYEMPEEIKKIVEKVVGTQSPEEVQKLNAYVTADVKQRASVSFPTGLFALSYRPDGKQIAVTGGDGLIRLLNPENAGTIRAFHPITITPLQQDETEQLAQPLRVVSQDRRTGDEKLPVDAQVVRIEVSPASIELKSPFENVQLLVTGILSTNDRIDLTRLASIELPGDSAGVNDFGRVYGRHNGSAALAISFKDFKTTVPISVAGIQSDTPVNFIRDVNPVLTRIGCNQGTCHGANDGKNGFKLSLRGYDPLFDVRSLTDDLKGRRVTVAAPDKSLMLLKASGSVPHVGGQLTVPGDAYYEVIRRWVEQGAELKFDVERVTGISIEPQNPVVQLVGAKQQLRVIATYSNGRTRDVTSESFLESGNTDVAESNRAAIVTAVRRGEAPILARFEGQYAATTLTVMGDRSGFAWQAPESWGRVDDIVAMKWERMKISPSDLSADEVFLRRVYLDLTGLPPSADEVVAFIEDSRPTRVKRDEVISRLIGSDAYVQFWTNKWADMLQVNSKFLGTEGAVNFRNWIHQNVKSNRPYNEFCYDILTATGSTRENPAASYYKILREPEAIMENTTHLFLGVRFNCNKCHDHPFERWTQDQYYETAAFFSQVGLKRDSKNPDGNLGGTAVEFAKPLWEEVFDKPDGDMIHVRTGGVTNALVPYNRDLSAQFKANDEKLTRRQQLAKWMVSAENEYFARGYVNRVWGYLMGAGLIEPLDDIRAGNPPTNPELLDYLTATFIESGFDVQQLMTTICKSRVYQLEIATNKWNADDRQNYSHALPKRLPAEVLYDAVYTVTGAKMQIPGVPEGTRAAALPDVKINLADGFLDNLGRPVRESSCECERSADLQLGPIMALMNGPTVSDAISQPGNQLEKLAGSEIEMTRLIDQVFLRVLNRHSTQNEIQATLALMSELTSEQSKLVAERDAYREKIRPQREANEQKRIQAIAETEQRLAAYKLEIQPRIEVEEAARQQRILEARAKVDARLQTSPQRVGEWEATLKESFTPWTSLVFSEMKSSVGSTFQQAPDQSVLVAGPNGKGNYELTAKIPVSQLAGLKIEAMTDGALPNKGPGRSSGGNYVLTELTVQIWAEATPDQKTNLKLQNAKADFSQNGYSVASAIDGKVAPNGNGWAVSPEVGKDHQATFEIAEPDLIAKTIEGDAIIHLTLDQQYQDGTHSLGKFRISVTNQSGALNFGLPAQIVDALKTKPEERTAEQKAVLADHVNKTDKELADLRAALAATEQPLPTDPGIVEWQNRLDDHKKPLAADPQLERFERAVALGENQLKNIRLTTVQDLTWALVNSPAFLFNH
ncbi:DUF1549 domain-containing protein [Planctomicrobium sp. SH527]|uniref:DUF1549 domain-containing protein n=1 Tax=Planctomicrobium sp. SH527 TaxID=3448123 RepID=UPI003F5AF5CC